MTPDHPPPMDVVSTDEIVHEEDDDDDEGIFNPLNKSPLLLTHSRR